MVVCGIYSCPRLCSSEHSFWSLNRLFLPNTKYFNWTCLCTCPPEWFHAQSPCSTQGNSHNKPACRRKGSTVNRAVSFNSLKAFYLLNTHLILTASLSANQHRIPILKSSQTFLTTTLSAMKLFCKTREI